MTHRYIATLLLPCFLLAACGGSDDKQTSDAAAKQTASDSSGSAPAKIPEVNAEQAAAPALGTAVGEIVGSKMDAAGKANPEDGFTDMDWNDLLPEGFKPEQIMAKYQAEIQATEEGSPEERVLYKKVMGEFNSAGANQSLDGKKVRIPGFVAPLDTNGDLVGDFLLVPYYGSCIHSPPPPAHQTVMVEPAEGKSVSLNDIYRPVWVVGEIEVDEIDTDLAKAGYQIKNAKVVPYTQPAH